MNIFPIFRYLNSRAYVFRRRIQSHRYRSLPHPRRSSKERKGSEPLYGRISPIGNPKVSLVPALDQWIAEGNSTYKSELQRIIQVLSNYRRFKHALEVSFWMTNKRNFPLAPFDAAIRLKLIWRVFGLEQAEVYFNMTPEDLRTHHVHLALLNCYALDKSVDKAESLMQKVRDLGYASRPIWYNLIMNLHRQLGNRDKVRELLMEMDEKGIHHDQFTVCVCIKACTEAFDAEGIDKIMMMVDAESWSITGQWQVPVVAVQGYLRMGLVDKAMALLDKLEGQLMSCKRINILFVLLFRAYAEAGSKDRLYWVWDLYKQSGKSVTKVYMGMMRALMKFGDVGGMEKIYEEWESHGLEYDFRVANFLIEAYCAQGDMEKAEALIHKGKSKGGVPVVATWCHLAGGYLANKQVPRATEALKNAIGTCPPRFSSHKETLISCLEHLKNGDGDQDSMEKVAESIKSMRSMRVSDNDDEWCGSIKDEEVKSFGHD